MFGPPQGYLGEERRQYVDYSVERERCFLTVSATDREPTGYKRRGAVTDPLAAVIEQVIHIPGLRGNPERIYSATATGHKYPGPFHPYVASIIHDWQSTRAKELELLAEDLKDLGLTWKVEVRRVDDVSLELKVGRTPQALRSGAKDLVNVADVGFGGPSVPWHACWPGPPVAGSLSWPRPTAPCCSGPSRPWSPEVPTNSDRTW